MFQGIKVTILGIFLIIAVPLLATCASKNAGTQQGENRMASKTIEEVLNENTRELMSIPGVVGTAQGLCSGKPCIKVYVVKKTPDLDKKIPKSIEGFPVSIEETGEITPLPKKQ